MCLNWKFSIEELSFCCMRMRVFRKNAHENAILIEKNDFVHRSSARSHWTVGHNGKIITDLESPWKDDQGDICLFMKNDFFLIKYIGFRLRLVIARYFVCAWVCIGKKRTLSHKLFYFCSHHPFFTLILYNLLKKKTCKYIYSFSYW